jgi:hypothetical protein
MSIISSQRRFDLDDRSAPGGPPAARRSRSSVRRAPEPHLGTRSGAYCVRPPEASYPVTTPRWGYSRRMVRSWLRRATVTPRITIRRCRTLTRTAPSVVPGRRPRARVIGLPSVHNAPSRRVSASAHGCRVLAQTHSAQASSRRAQRGCLVLVPGASTGRRNLLFRSRLGQPTLPARVLLRKLPRNKRQLRSAGGSPCRGRAGQGEPQGAGQLVWPGWRTTLVQPSSRASKCL